MYLNGIFYWGGCDSCFADHCEELDKNNIQIEIPEGVVSCLDYFEKMRRKQTHEDCPTCGARKNKTHSTCENTACWYDEKEKG